MSQVYVTSFLTDLPVIGKLEALKMPFKYPNFFPMGPWQGVMAQFLIIGLVPAYIS